MENKDLAPHASDFVAAQEPRSSTLVSDGWQPIDTAPKDGHMLVYCARFAEVMEARHDYGDDWRASSFNGQELQCQPTHWMPLPAPPTS